ncbi:hypothetical protein VZT92_004953 [Zoarces viviparus]|uniref:Uncharacterized protein n=1 Tax=Zoarces viviparus TaxID=48416 RepID=A0AAW1FUE6_ZOAVI
MQRLACLPFSVHFSTYRPIPSFALAFHIRLLLVPFPRCVLLTRVLYFPTLPALSTYWLSTAKANTSTGPTHAAKKMPTSAKCGVVLEEREAHPLPSGEHGCVNMVSQISASGSMVQNSADK